MPETEYVQRWLTLDEIASTLRLSKPIIISLAKAGTIAAIWSRGMKYANARFLDPTPEYAEHLRLASILYGETHYIPPHLSQFALLSLREVAAICGWTHKYAMNYMARHEVPSIRVSPRLYLYTVETVRNILWKREKRSLIHQRSPFLITHLIEWFRKQYKAETADAPTDAEFLMDDVIQRKLEKLVSMSESDQFHARADFAKKAELARKIVQILESGKD